MLLMKKVFFEPIRQGRKTTTLRFWKRPMLRPGRVHAVPGLGKVHIDAVRAVSLDDLTDADARADGFASRGELMGALAALYPDLAGPSPDRQLYCVAFTWMPTR